MQILIIDDSKTILHVLGTLLREIGYNDVAVAENVDKAKQHCKKSPPTLIISDWNMPGDSGLDFLKYIRGNPETADIPFIMLTTQTERNKIVEATHAGIQSYMLKPIKKQVLIEKLREISSTYGFDPPSDSGKTSAPAVQKSHGSDHPLKGKIKKEQVNSILEAYGKLWKIEMSVSEFEEFIRVDVLGCQAEDQTNDVELLLRYIQAAGRDGILNKLTQLV